MKLSTKGVLIAGGILLFASIAFLFLGDSQDANGGQSRSYADRAKHRLEKLHHKITGIGEDVGQHADPQKELQEKLVVENRDSAGDLLAIALGFNSEAAVRRLNELAPSSAEAAFACALLEGFTESDESLKDAVVSQSPASQMGLLIAAERSYKNGDTEGLLKTMKALQQGVPLEAQLDRLREQVRKFSEKEPGAAAALTNLEKSSEQFRGAALNQISYLGVLAIESSSPDAVSAFKDEQLNVMNSISQASAVRTLRSKIEQLSAIESLLRAVPEVPLSPDQQAALRAAREQRLALDIRLRKANAVLSTSDPKLVTEYEQRRDSEGEEVAAKWLLGE